MKNISWILLGVTSLVCLFGGVQVVSKLNGEANLASAITPLLAVTGLITLAMGAKGFLQSKSQQVMMPLVTSLSLVIGALALLMALYFLLP